MSLWILGGLLASLQVITFTQALEQSQHAPLLVAASAVESAR
jgi:hypothetical protein